jgi:hypothetical protein
MSTRTIIISGMQILASQLYWGIVPVSAEKEVLMLAGLNPL